MGEFVSRKHLIPLAPDVKVSWQGWSLVGDDHLSRDIRLTRGLALTAFRRAFFTSTLSSSLGKGGPQTKIYWALSLLLLYSLPLRFLCSLSSLLKESSIPSTWTINVDRGIWNLESGTPMSRVLPPVQSQWASVLYHRIYRPAEIPQKLARGVN